MVKSESSRTLTCAAIIGILIVLLPTSSVAQPATPYTIAASPWPEHFGNHRAIIEIEEPADAVRVQFLWRRHDPGVQKRRLIVVDAETGEEVGNILRVQVSPELCDIVAGPITKPGRYFSDHLPYEVVGGWGSYNKDYFKPESPPAPSWASSVQSDLDSITRAKVTTIQSRTPFDSFFPMEVISTENEKSKLLSSTDDPYLLFPESREFPIRMRDEIPLKWLDQERRSFKGSALRNEYYAFQVGVVAARHALDRVKVIPSDLKEDKGGIIPSSSVTCFNTDGVDPDGSRFSKNIHVDKGSVQALWLGVDVKADTKPGKYRGTITIEPANSVARNIAIELTVTNAVLADRGDSEPWRHSRLRWLNSTLGTDDHPTAAYSPLKSIGKNRVECLGRSVQLADSGLPAQITSFGTTILSAPMQFLIETPEGVETPIARKSVDLKKSDGILKREWFGETEHFTLHTILIMEFDGYLNYHCILQAKSAIGVKDVRLSMPFKTEVAQYMMGMGLPGTTVPRTHNAPWKGPQDSFWIGNTYGGIHCELRGSTYNGPLLNLYKPAPPTSWNNSGKGGFALDKGVNATTVNVYTGARQFAKAQSIEFEFSLLITPVKQLDVHSQFANRYYHGGSIEPTPAETAAGIKIVNIHHANIYNPYINYPFIATKEMKALIDRLHRKGMKGKIYYTVRELTNHATEIWALRSLGNEILAGGTGGGYPWLREHFVNDYTPQWYQHFDGEAFGVDASILTATGDSRWLNYYAEGLDWLAKYIGIDGLYLDDVAYDRRILKRVRKVLERENHSSLIDLHSNTGFSQGPATQYAEFYPYIDKLWFGEYFQYDTMSPANWLVEVSGIPFGLMGDMLQEGGNRWRGMVYGMTSRLPCGAGCDPRPVWKIWDSFGIADARMVGYWDGNPVVRTSHPDILATAYLKDRRALVAIASWTDKVTAVQLEVDWKRLGLDPTTARIIAPPIDGYQREKEFLPSENIIVEPRKGWLLYLQQ